MSKQFGLPVVVATSVLSCALASLATYVAMKPADPEAVKARQAQTLVQSQEKNRALIERTVKHPLLARQLIKSNVMLKSEVLDSGETAIGMTGLKNAYLVQAPNAYRSSRNVHYTTWKYTVYKDEMRGTTSRTASIGNLIEYTGNMNEPFMLTLHITCEDGANSCQMYFASQFTFDAAVTGFINRTLFNIQLDNKELQQFGLDLGENYQSAIATDKLYRYLYDNLESAKRLRVELQSGSTGQFEFDLSGFEWKKFNALTLAESTAKLKH